MSDSPDLPMADAVAEWIRKIAAERVAHIGDLSVNAKSVLCAQGHLGPSRGAAVVLRDDSPPGRRRPWLTLTVSGQGFEVTRKVGRGPKAYGFARDAREVIAGADLKAWPGRPDV